MSPHPESNLDWLAAWRTAEREPVFFSHDPHVWRMLEAVWLNDTVVFSYHGGSTPGIARRVSPDALFRVADCSGIYASGVCHLRGARRVFRLDRVQWPEDQGRPQTGGFPGSNRIRR